MVAVPTTILVLLIILAATTRAELSNIPIKTHKYEYDGSGNNINNPRWGTAGSPRIRRFPSEDGFKERPGVPRSEFTDGLPSARQIMEELFRFPALKKKKASTSTNDLKLLFGMVVDGDILGAAGKNESEPFDLTGDGNFTDGIFCPVTGKFEATDGYAKSFPRYNHQLVETPDGEAVRATSNKGTSWMDLGCLYGTTEKENQDIRTFEGGNFDMVDNGNGLLPRKPYLRECFGVVPGTYSLQVLWMRLHNHVAKIIADEHLGMVDEDIFQAARNYVTATYQKNVITKYIPALLGDSMGPYQGYDPSLDPSLDEYFGAVTYRYGHSEQPGVVRLVDEDFLPTSDDPILLRSAYHGNPQQIVERAGGIEVVLRGATMTPTKSYDYYFEDDLNFFAKATSMVDVQRARDVGIPPYNQARRNIGLEPMSSIRELVVTEGGYDNDELVRVMENLYGNDIEKVDSYVATLFEKPTIPDGLFGPSLTKSTRDQIHRIRSGDRFWYENTFTEDEINALPSLTEAIKLVCEGMDKFPETFFRVYGFEQNGPDRGGEDDNCEGEFKNQVGLLGGDMTMKWIIDQPQKDRKNANKRTTDEALESTIELTITANTKFEGAGYLGIGWRSRKMAGADIWFCTVNPGLFGQGLTPDCDDRQTTADMFHCCVANGANIKPSCLNPEDSRHYELDVINWCLSPEESSVTVKALVCDENVETDCFEIASNPDGTIDMIISYNPNDQNRPHGFQRRTSTVVDLKAGITTAAEDGIADTGLIAYHGITMLLFWMIMAPIGIYIVRYMKTKSWRLAAHISIMGVVGGLTIPIIVGVESAVGASTDKTQEHSMIGIALTLLFLPMFFAGRIRYSKLKGRQVGRRTGHYALIFHKCFGYGILVFSWWNCYTGLVRISPADAYFQLVVLSSYSIGYDVPIFGYIKDSVYWPYLGMVCLIYAVAEMRKRVLNRMMHNQTATKIWDSETDDPQDYDEMGMDRFLELVKLGSPLCIIDGRVLDLTGFLEHHPGGSDMLENIAGTEITDEVKGLRAIEGFSHKHSYIAVQKMRSLIIGILVDEADDKVPPLPKFLQAAKNMKRTSAHRKISDIEASSDGGSSSFHFGRPNKAVSQLFRRARIVHTGFVTPSNEITQDNKPVVMLYLAAPKRRDLDSKDGFIVPTSAYKFRVTNPWGTAFEAYYTPVSLNSGTAMEKIGNKFDLAEEEELLKFFITLRPGGQISRACMAWKVGKTIPILGPSVNPVALHSIDSNKSYQPVIMFAAGTGIAPMLQMIDFYIAPKKIKQSPCLFLVWLLKSPIHNYNEWIGLEERVQAATKGSKSKLRWVVLYSSSESSSSNKKEERRTKEKQKERSKEKPKEGAIREGSERDDHPVESTTMRSPRTSRKALRKSSYDDKGGRRKFRGGQGNNNGGGRLSENQADALGFMHRLEDDDTIDASSRREEDSTNSRTEDDEDEGFEVEIVNDVFWRVHGNKCMTLKFNQDVVTRLTKAAQAEFDREENSSKRGSSRMFGHLSSTEEDADKGMMAYICGSPMFDDSVQEMLVESGLAKENITNFYTSPSVHI